MLNFVYASLSVFFSFHHTLSSADETETVFDIVKINTAMCMNKNITPSLFLTKVVKKIKNNRSVSNNVGNKVFIQAKYREASVIF